MKNKRENFRNNKLKNKLKKKKLLIKNYNKVA